MKQNVNFIKHYLKAQDLIFSNEKFTSSHIVIYNALFLIWNSSGFEENVSINRNDVMNLAKVGSVNTYYKCLNDLQDAGFIKYIPSHNPLKGSIINLFRFDTTDEQLMNKFRTSHDITDEQQVIPYINSINNKTNKLINNETEDSKINFATTSDFEIFDLEKKEKDPTKKVALKKDDNAQFRQFFIELGYDKDLLDEWLLIRKKKRAVNTLTSAKMFHDEVMKTGWDVNKILKIVVTKQWVGFQDDWNWNDTKKQNFGKEEQTEFIWRK